MNTLKDLVTHPNVIDVNYMQGPEGVWSCTVWDWEEHDNETLHSDDLEDLSKQVQSWLDERKPKSVWDIVENEVSSPLLITKDHVGDFAVSMIRNHKWVTRTYDTNHVALKKAMAERHTVLHFRALRFLDMDLPEIETNGYGYDCIYATKRKRNFIFRDGTGVLEFSNGSIHFGCRDSKLLAKMFVSAIKEGWIDLEASDD